MAKSKKIEMIPASKLTVDPAIQRSEEKHHVDRLAAQWNDDLCGVLVGSRRADGRVYLLDGQQRWLAQTTRKNNFKYVFPVMVHSGLSLKEEALIFQGYNKGRKNVGPYANHRVSIIAEDPVAMAVEDAVTGIGFTTGASSHGTTVGCIATLYRIVQRKSGTIADQAYFLQMALDTSHQVYGKTDDPFRGDIVEALALFWEKHWDDPNIDQAVLVRKMAAYTVPQLIAASRARAIGNNRPTTVMCTILEEAYNHRRKAGAKLKSVA